MNLNKLVPELVVSDFALSLEFYTKLLGFKVLFARENPQFVCLELESVQFMLEEFREDGWNVGVLEKPYGRGINFQIELDDIQPIYNRLTRDLAKLGSEADRVRLFREIKDNWYNTGKILLGQREFLVQDPDGYLLRFSQFLGERTISTE